MASRAASPSNEVPYPTEVGTATRHSGQAADDGWQGSLHSRDHDETVGPVEVVAHIQQAVQTRDADVDDRRHVRAEGASGVGSLDGDRPVRCSRGNDDHVSPRCRPFPDGRASSILVYVSVPAEGPRTAARVSASTRVASASRSG